MMVINRQIRAPRMEKGVLAVIKGGILGIVLGLVVFVAITADKPAEARYVHSP